MSKPLDLATDWHSHTSHTTGGAPIDQMVSAATTSQLRRLHITDRVHATSTWLPDYVAEISRARAQSAIDLVCGVETQILDVRGSLDLPRDLRGVEQIVVSDELFPTRAGPVPPAEMRRRIESGEVLAIDAVADLVLATARAVFAHERVVVGHLFGVLPHAGICLSTVSHDMIDTLAAAIRSAGAFVEVNERWRTPSLGIVTAMCARGVDFVPSSDAHNPTELGQWDHVAAAAASIAP